MRPTRFSYPLPNWQYASVIGSVSFKLRPMQGPKAGRAPANDGTRVVALTGMGNATHRPPSENTLSIVYGLGWALVRLEYVACN